MTTELFDPQVGDIVCDCRYKHLTIAKRDEDDLILEDGSYCSLKYCCDPADHEWEHPPEVLDVKHWAPKGDKEKENIE